MFTPCRSVGSEFEGPPKRSEVDSNPLPVAFGGSGVGRAAFGVGAVDDDDFDGALISGIGFGGSQIGSTSIAPSRMDTEAITVAGGEAWVEARTECAEGGGL